MDVALSPGIDLGELDLGALLRDPVKAIKERILQMAGFSNGTEAKILDAAMGGTAYSVTDGNQKIALVTVAVTDTDDSTTITKATYTGYADLTIATADWNAASAGSKTNSAVKTFGLCTAGSSTVIGFAIFDNSSHLISMYGTVTSIAISAGITPSFAASSLTATLD